MKPRTAADLYVKDSLSRSLNDRNVSKTAIHREASSTHKKIAMDFSLNGATQQRPRVWQQNGKVGYFGNSRGTKMLRQSVWV